MPQCKAVGMPFEIVADSASCRHYIGRCMSDIKGADMRVSRTSHERVAMNGFEISPLLSCGGEWLVFAHGPSPELDIYTVAATGGKARPLHLATTQSPAAT